MANEYVFVDEWNVNAPPAAVFDALADARTYPKWWVPSYLAVDSDGPPEVGRVSSQTFKGKLPYKLSTQSTIVRCEPPREFDATTVMAYWQELASRVGLTMDRFEIGTPEALGFSEGSSREAAAK